MKKIFVITLAILLMVVCLGYSQNKLAQTGFQFLSVSGDARASAMGEAYTTVEGTSSALFYNPACMARVPGTVDLVFSQNKWIADITHFSGSVAVRPFSGKFGVLGLSMQSVDYGEFLGTVVAKNEAGFEDTGTFSPSAFMVGVGYANDLTDRFAVGGQIKYVRQELGSSYIPKDPYQQNPTLDDAYEKEYAKSAMAFDFGTVYKTGFKSLAFGMTVRNFSKEVKYEREGFQLPLTFKIGFSMNAMDFLPGLARNHSLLLSVDAAHPRDFPEYLNMGAEYMFMNKLALRAGYISQQSDYGLSAGFGVQMFGLAIHYSYQPFTIFDDVNRFSIQLTF